MKAAIDQIEPNFRRVAYAIVNCHINQQRLWMQALDMDPATLMVYSIVALASVQKLTRQKEIPEEMRGIDPLPQELVGTISRRAIASASGIPREQVRRIVSQLLASGRLITSGRNAVRVPYDNIRNEGLLDAVTDIVPDIVKMINELRKAGVVVNRFPPR